jgi:hypothetical protein
MARLYLLKTSDRHMTILVNQRYLFGISPRNRFSEYRQTLVWFQHVHRFPIKMEAKFYFTLIGSRNSGMEYFIVLTGQLQFTKFRFKYNKRPNLLEINKKIRRSQNLRKRNFKNKNKDLKICLFCSQIANRQTFSRLFLNLSIL